MRVGSGYDVHTFGPGDHVTLGGVRIPFDRGVVAHSDGDVTLHALCDALLGAMGLGDIGEHFPPSDPQWKGAASDIFLIHAAALIRAGGGIIDHVDCTIICEEPKVGPHRLDMRRRVAAVLGLGEGQVSIKATTTEGLGFTGRREGVAAQAVASVRMGWAE
jgi:2-C-methyl-D-erythritol 4-phosphate cytidylyltransferase/2-C-methyl-D-erythritol 2,4-cyclodiphosphate synthase